jgi:polyferredoxin
LIAPYSTFGRIVGTLLNPIYAWGNNCLAYLAERVGSYAFYRVDVWVKGTVTLLVASLTLMILAFSAANHGRLWCNAVCPVGTLLGLVSRFAFFKPVFDLEKCNGCGICSRKCKAECIDPALHQIDLSRCVACYDCVEACRQKAISIGLYNKTAQEVPNETSKEAEK